MSTKMIPQLRFPEFTDVWQVRKLDDITQINPRVGSLPDDFVYIDLDSVKRGTLLKQNRISKIGSPSRAQRLLSRDDIIYQTVRPYQKNNFYFDKAGDYVASTGYAQIRAREGYYPRFVYTLLHTSNFVNKVLVRSTGTNYPAINSNDLAKVKVHTPSKPEQEKIADFLTAVDERIAVGEKKLELLETYKRGAMQKIFSQQVRFKDDNGNPYPDWEEKKLKHVLKIRGERNSKKETNEVFSVAKNAGVINQIEHLGRSFASKEISNYKVVRPGDIIYTKSPTSDFPYGIIKQNMTNRTGVVSILYGVYVPVNIYIGRILDEYFKSWQNTYNYLNPIVQKGAKNTINIGDAGFLEGRTMHLPVSEDEQQKIANFLTTLDEKITAEKSKLTAARQFKKALLQRMFV